MRIGILMALLLCWSGLAFAGTADFGGTQNDAFSNVPEALALGEAMVGRLTYFSGLYNPATTIFNNQHTFISSQQTLLGGGNTYSLHWSGPIRADLFGSASLTEFQLTQIPIVSTESATVTTDVEAEKYSVYTSRAINLSAAYSIRSDWRVGLSGTLQLIGATEITGASMIGGELTPGLYWHQSEEWAWGVSIKNMISYRKWATGFTEHDSPEIQMGGQWTPVKIAFLTTDILGELDIPTVSAPKIIRLGVNHRPFECFDFRWGLVFHNSTLSQVSSGFALRFDRYFLEYAYMSPPSEAPDPANFQSLFSIGIHL